MSTIITYFLVVYGILSVAGMITFIIGIKNAIEVPQDKDIFLL